MDKRLFEAAWTGNVEYLFELLKENCYMLEVVALAGGETPLHIACLAGHLDFVKEILKLKKEFASELNQDGFAPLHIAAANGRVEIVKEILKIDRNLCQLKGREGMTPLHSGVIKGRVDVIKELISVSVDSIANTTARRETALHLAVKNNQFEAFRLLVNHLTQLKMEDLLNEKDGQGNTIFHLAVSKKQYQVIDYVLNKRVDKVGVDVNSLNKRALTPLDVLLLFQSEAGDREIEDILRQAGAVKAEDLHSLPEVVISEERIKSTNNQTNEQPPMNHARSRATQLLEYFQYDHIKDSQGEVRNILLVVVILIATATYQAVLSPPGGVWQDDVPSNHTAGKTIMGSKNPAMYGLFLLFNSVGFFTSLLMINVLTAGFPMRFELLLSILALTVTYDLCMTEMAPNKFLNRLFVIISIVLPLIIATTTLVGRSFLKKLTKRWI
ncbi:hypothetical protein LguiA_019316 [Lonicera macranthoides]